MERVDMEGEWRIGKRMGGDEMRVDVKSGEGMGVDERGGNGRRWEVREMDDSRGDGIMLGEVREIYWMV